MGPPPPGAVSCGQLRSAGRAGRPRAGFRRTGESGHYRRVARSAGTDDRPVRALRSDPGRPVEEGRWPATVPAVAQIAGDGLELPSGLTVLVGENGSGKSTVVEIIAEACGLNPQGGSVLSPQGGSDLARSFRTRNSEPGIGSVS